MDTGGAVAQTVKGSTTFSGLYSNHQWKKVSGSNLTTDPRLFANGFLTDTVPRGSDST